MRLEPTYHWAYSNVAVASSSPASPAAFQYSDEPSAAVAPKALPIAVARAPTGTLRNSAAAVPDWALAEAASADVAARRSAIRARRGDIGMAI